MFIAGVEVTTSAAALLALLLERARHTELAQRIGFAVDNGRLSISLSPAQRSQALNVLNDPPEGLAPLKEALQRRRQESEPNPPT